MAFTRRKEGFSGGFKGGSKFGGASRGRGFGDRGNMPPLMFPAVCSDCSARCEVPFRPNGKKPVLCKNCFGQSRDGAPSFAPRREDHRPMNIGGNDNTAEQLRVINKKLDAIMEALEI